MRFVQESLWGVSARFVWWDFFRTRVSLLQTISPALLYFSILNKILFIPIICKFSSFFYPCFIPFCVVMFLRQFSKSLTFVSYFFRSFSYGISIWIPDQLQLSRFMNIWSLGSVLVPALLRCILLYFLTLYFYFSFLLIMLLTSMLLALRSVWKWFDFRQIWVLFEWWWSASRYWLLQVIFYLTHYEYHN